MLGPYHSPLPDAKKRHASDAKRWGSGWRVLQRPDASLDLGVSLPLGATLAIGVVVLWILFTPWQPARIDYFTLIAVFAVLAPLHEGVHALAFPRNVVRTLRFRRVNSAPVLAAECADPMSRRQYLAVLAMPLVILSAFPVLAGAITDEAPDFVVWLSLANALVASGDVMAMLLLLTQVPEGALVQQRAGEVVWRLDVRRSAARA